MHVHIKGVIYNIDRYDRCYIEDGDAIVFSRDDNEYDAALVRFDSNEEAEVEFKKIVSVIENWYFLS